MEEAERDMEGAKPMNVEQPMSELRKELHDCLDCLPESKLQALKPILTLLADDAIVIETDLTDEEKESIRRGREEYKKGTYVSLDSIE